MESILGQVQAIATLQAALDSGKVHHAWILHGPLGVGKFTSAIEMAKILLDPDAGPDLMGVLRADSTGETARLVDRGTHPDLHVIRKEMALTSSVLEVRKKKLTNIPVDLVRELMIGGETQDGRFHDSVAFHTPVRGHNKVFIIDEAELLADGRNVTQNAMLKTLEEPPPGTFIFLITTQIDRLLPTVRSRCQRVAFTTLDEDAMGVWLERRRQHEQSSEAGALTGLADSDLEWVVRFAAGSPGLALLAAESGMHAWRAQLAPMLRELRQGRYPAEMGPMLAELADNFATDWVKRHDNASKDLANKDGGRRVFLLLAAHARGGLHRAVETGGDPQPWLSAIDCIRAAERQLFNNVNMKHVLENLVVQWADGFAAVAAG